MKFNIKASSLFVLFLISIYTNSKAQTLRKANNSLIKTINKSFTNADKQYSFLMTQLAPNQFPSTYDERNKSMVTTGPTPWVAGFYPGTLLYLFENTGDSVLYQEAVKKMKWLEKEQYNKTTHDLGFMMYCSFGNLYRLSPKPEYRDIIISSAKTLSRRFSARVGCIRSWDSDSSRYMVIIDNMMNLELLFAATHLTGDSSYYKIAVTHANTTLKNHFRPDFSSYHLVIYNPKTGEVAKKQTVQGAFDESAWARGQAWGLYGYTMMYRETKDNKYLNQANGIAQFILNNPNLPADKIPYWDFNAPGIPNTPRDVSAGAIMCSALIELSQFTDSRHSKQYLHAAETMLRSLSSPAYRASSNENGGFLLKHGVGNYPHNSDIDVALIYADYYYTEAMNRYKKLMIR